MKKIILGLTLLAAADCSFADDISLIPVGATQHIVQNGSHIPLHYVLKVRNNSNVPTYLNRENISGNLPNMQLDTANTTCQFYATGGTGIHAIPPQSTCQLAYTSQAPTLPIGAKKSTTYDSILVTTQMGYTAIYRNVSVTVKQKTTALGQFSFEQGGALIHALNLSAKQSGTVALVNTGHQAITGFSLTGLGTGFSDINCASKRLLTPGESCQFRYDIGAKPTTAKFQIKAVGDTATANNSPKILPVDVTSLGRLSFQQHGSPISSLKLAAKQSGTIDIVNTGGTTITNFKLTDLGTGFSDITCASKSRLAPRQSCQFHYDIGSKPTATNFNIKATGDAATVETTPQLLPVEISSLGHLSFEQGGSPISSLNLAARHTNTVTVVNTGGTTITNFKLKDLGTDFHDIDCARKTSLAPQQSCQFRYTIGATPTTANFAIHATGDAITIDNTPASLPVLVLSGRSAPVFVAVGDDGVILISSNGINWVTGTNYDNHKLNSITYANGYFVSGGDAGTILSASNVRTWDYQSISGWTNNIGGIFYGNGHYFLLGAGDTMSSTDLINWSPKTICTSCSLTTGVYGDGHYVIARNIVGPTRADYGAPPYWSNDGSSWSTGNASRYIGGTGSVFVNHKFYIVGLSWYHTGHFWTADNHIFTSSNAKDWTFITLSNRGTPDTLRSIAYGAGKFITVGNKGIIYTSTDGTNWTPETRTYTENFRGIAYGNNQFIIVGDQGLILTSPNGVTWTKQNSGVTENLNAITARP